MILALTGYSKVGKDAVAKVLTEYQKMKRIAFADALKKDVCKLCDLSMENLERYKEMLRPLLVEYGRARRSFDADFWIKRIEKQMRKEDFPDRVDWVITDLRYVNEADWVVRQGGLIVYLVRLGTNPANSEEGKSIPDILNGRPEIKTVVNREDRIAQTAESVWKLFEEHKLAHKSAKK